MRKVYLHGDLKQHGEVFDLHVETAAEAVAALGANIPELIEDIRAGKWFVMRGDPETGMSLDEEAIAGLRLGNADLHILPAVAGAKNGNGILKAVVGVALIAVSFGGASFLAQPISSALLGATTWGNAIGQLGLALTLSGVSSMLAPEQEAQTAEEDTQSFTMTGPRSQYGQGHAIQIIYGEVITGGMLISGGVDAEGLEIQEEEPTSETDPEAVPAQPSGWNQK